MEAIPERSIIIIDGGVVRQWTATTAGKSHPQTVMVVTGYVGMLGNSWGCSLGAGVAEPFHLVVSVHGDHSAGFHIQELDTSALFGLKIVTIPGSNYVWGVSVNGQDLLYDGVTDKRPAIQLSKACRYDIVA